MASGLWARARCMLCTAVPVRAVALIRTTERQRNGPMAPPESFFRPNIARGPSGQWGCWGGVGGVQRRTVWRGVYGWRSPGSRVPARSVARHMYCTCHTCMLYNKASESARCSSRRRKRIPCAVRRAVCVGSCVLCSRDVCVFSAGTRERRTPLRMIQLSISPRTCTPWALRVPAGLRSNGKYPVPPDGSAERM